MNGNWLTIGCAGVVSSLSNYLIYNTTVCEGGEFQWYLETASKTLDPVMQQRILKAAKEAEIAFKRKCSEIEKRSKLPSLYCGLSISLGLYLGSLIAKKIVPEEDNKKRIGYEIISGVALTALLTYCSTRSKGSTINNMTFGILSIGTKYILQFIS